LVEFAGSNPKRRLLLRGSAGRIEQGRVGYISSDTNNCSSS
jgi:hypothetical protein